MRVRSGSEHPLDLAHDLLRSADVLENSVALDPLKDAGREGELFRIRGDIHAGHGEEVKIDVSVDYPPRSPDVQIPSAQRKIPGLGWIHEERRRRL
jgi:hypothetical protein